MPELYIGLMSGTSMDGIDAVLVDLSNRKPQLVDTHYDKMPQSLRAEILAIHHPGPHELERLGKLDIALGKQFALSVNALLKKNNLSPQQIQAIGSHGQTIRHLPSEHFTLQIGDPNIIAAATGITTIADFRRRDMALGGQGAPLVPAFHHDIFSAPDKTRLILNVGGIANITVLPHKVPEKILGFDTGPGNTLLDAWIQAKQGAPYDQDGAWAKKGKVIPSLLEQLLRDPFFALSPPKSTGRDYFNLSWLEQHLASEFKPEDVQATLAELSAESICLAIQTLALSNIEIYVCGGGVHNKDLIERIRKKIDHSLDSTEALGVSPDWVEALAFAWLAKQTLEKKPGNVTTVTGARTSSILGGIYYA